MNGAEFLRKLRKLARATGAEVGYNRSRGKGSHGTLYYGDKWTIVKDLKKEISPGLLSAMLKQLGISRENFDQ